MVQFLESEVSALFGITNWEPESLLSLCKDVESNGGNTYLAFRSFTKKSEFNHFRELDDAFEDACQSFSMILEGVAQESTRDIPFLSELWDNLCLKGEPDLLLMKIGYSSLVEFMLQNRIMMSEVNKWATESQNSDRLLNVLRGVEKYSDSHQSGEDGEMKSPLHSNEEGGEVEMKSNQEGSDEEEEKEVELLDHSLDPKDVPIKPKLDSILHSLLQLRLGSGKEYNHTWEDQMKEGEMIHKGIPPRYWPQVLTNLILNSPSSHPMVAEFLRTQGLKNWEELGGNEEFTLYPNPVCLHESESSWSGLDSLIPSKRSQFSSPQFYYALKINENIKSATLLDPRVIQSIGGSPILRDLVDVSCIHHIFESKWRSWGYSTTKLLLVLYFLFLFSSTGMILWISQDDTDHFRFKISFVISFSLLVFQILIEFKQMFSTWNGGESFLKSFELLFTDYFLDLWNILDFSVMIMWILVVSMIGTNPDESTLKVICASAAVVIWSKILYFGRGIRSFSILLEILKTIVADMRYFMLLLVMFLGAFSVAFRCVKLDSSTAYSFLRVFNMMFGDFDSSEFEDISDLSVFTLPLFMIFMLVVPLIMLNALIAIMGDSFDRAQEKARASYLSSRAQLIAEDEVIGFNQIRPFFFQMNEFLQDWVDESLRVIPFLKGLWNDIVWETGIFEKCRVFFCLFLIVVLYFSLGIPIWVELLILVKIGFRFLGREEKGGLIVFYSEDYGGQRMSNLEMMSCLGSSPRSCTD